MYGEIYLTDRRFNMISRAKKYVAVLLVFVCVCMIFSPQTAYAAEDLSLIHISEPTRQPATSRMPSSA